MATLPKSATPRFAELRRQLQQLDYFCKGTVLARRMKCGQPSCACHTDPAKRHGPYWEWTRKIHGQTVNVRLSSEAGPIYQRASTEHRRLNSLLHQLEKTSRLALSALAKQAERAAKSAAKNRPRSGEQ